MKDQWLTHMVDRKLVRAVVVNFTAAIDVIYHFSTSALAWKKENSEHLKMVFLSVKIPTVSVPQGRYLGPL